MLCRAMVLLSVHLHTTAAMLCVACCTLHQACVAPESKGYLSGKALVYRHASDTLWAQRPLHVAARALAVTNESNKQS